MRGDTDLTKPVRIGAGLGADPPHPGSSRWGVPAGAGASPDNLRFRTVMLRKTHQPPEDDNRQWRCVPGYADLFASSDGQIWSAKTGTLKKQRNCSNGKGYKAIFLWENGRDRERRVHRLVTLAFHGLPPSEAHTPDHINRIRHDNRAENLRWATPIEQAANSAICKKFLSPSISMLRNPLQSLADIRP
jgi:hypothetical protein